MQKLSTYEETLLSGWEDVHKMGQLSLWLMLSLKDGPKHMAEIKAFMNEMTDGALTVDDKSIYRALRRYNETELIQIVAARSNSGPDLKVYSLTAIGERVLEQFLTRNIQIFYKPNVRKLTQ